MAGLWRRHGVALVLLALAAVFYLIGFRKGSTLALVLGASFEIAFLVRDLGRPKRFDYDDEARDRRR